MIEFAISLAGVLFFAGGLASILKAEYGSVTKGIVMVTIPLLVFLILIYIFKL